MKLGCVHVIVTNLVNWIMIVAREGAAIMAHTTLHSNHSHGMYLCIWGQAMTLHS